MFGLSAALIIAGLALLDLRGYIRPSPILRLLGTASFSIYLVNYSAIVIAVKIIQLAGIPLGSNITAFVLAGLAICGGLVFHFLVDQPLQRDPLRHTVVRLAGLTATTVTATLLPDRAYLAWRADWRALCPL